MAEDKYTKTLADVFKQLETSLKLSLVSGFFGEIRLTVTVQDGIAQHVRVSSEKINKLTA